MTHIAYTKTKPTEPGLYWVSRNGEEGIIVHIDYHHGAQNLCFRCEDKYHFLSFVNGSENLRAWWCGPLTEPTFPTGSQEAHSPRQKEKHRLYYEGNKDYNKWKGDGK